MRVDTRPLRHRDFRNLWIGQMISTLGGAIGTVAVPYQVYELTGSTALVGLLGLASLVPLLVVPLVGGAIADAVDRRTVLLRTETGMALVTGALPAERAAAAPAGLGALRAAGARGRRLQPRPAGDELARAAARAGRGDRGRVALDSVYNSLARRRRPGGRRPAHRGRRRAVDVGIDLRDVRRVARRALRAAEAAAARRGRPAERPLDPRRLPLPEGTPGAARDLRRRHERDGVRHAERALPGVRAAPLGGDASTVGYLYAAPYAGALVGSLLSGWTLARPPQGLAVTFWACVWGAAIAGFGFTTSLWPALVLLAVAGGADFYSAVLRSAMLLRVDAGPPARAPARDRVHAGGERAEPRRPRGRRARVADVAALLVVSGGLLCIVGCVVTALALPRLPAL